MNVSRAVVAFLILCVVASFGQEPSVPKLPHVPTGKVTEHGLDYKVPLSKEGLVPDEQTAIKIAEVVLFRLYGEESVTGQRPYIVTKDENIWWVCGTLHTDFGSAFRVAISQQTAAVLYIEG